MSIIPPLSMLIKPASSNCNLQCKYCFYHSLAKSRKIKSYGIMNSETLEIIVKKSLEFAEHSCSFAFQGGEPTLAGLDYYRKLIEYQKKYNTKKLQIFNALQTNGTTIHEEWAVFLAENKFLVGLSLDGSIDTHDNIRNDAKGKGSFNKVMKTIAIFNKRKVEYNILFVVTSHVGRHISKTYSFFRRHGFDYLQFIPCLDPIDELPGNYEYSLTPDRFEYFLKTLFDLWYEDISKGTSVSIRYFDNLIQMLMGYSSESCGMLGECSCQFVIEADGGVYPCDFYVNDEWYLGNIKESGFAALKASEICMHFEHVSRYIDPKCKACSWYALCRGGCRRSKEPIINEQPGVDYFCEAYSNFFAYALPRLKALASKLSAR